MELACGREAFQLWLAMIMIGLFDRSRRRCLWFSAAWLGVRPAAKELLIVRTTRGAANELAREVARWKGAAWLVVRRLALMANIRFIRVGIFRVGRPGASAHWALTRQAPARGYARGRSGASPTVYAGLNEHPSWSLAATGSLSTEVLVAFTVEDAQSDRSRRPSDICRSDDCCR
jgi:hypothetical protein